MKKETKDAIWQFLCSNTYYIFIACSFMLMIQIYVPNSNKALVLSDNHPLRLYTWITHMFMHGSLMHFLCNMIGVVTIGYGIEKIMGKKKFLILYFLSGIAGAMLQIMFDSFLYPDKINAYVGASGALCGLIGALAYYRPNTKLLLFFIIPMRTITVFWLAIGSGFVFYIWNFIEQSGGVAHLAHTGGLIAGMLLAKKLHHCLIILFEAYNLKGDGIEGKAYTIDAALEILIDYPVEYKWVLSQRSRTLTVEEHIRMNTTITAIDKIVEKFIEDHPQKGGVVDEPQ